MKKRKIDIVALSDVHLGSNECHADELIAYLNSICPKKIVLNGDILDIWQFDKGYFPSSHMNVLKKIFSLAANGSEIYYVTGNHDGILRRFSGTSMGNIHLVDELVLELDGKKAWFFHGDIFDVAAQNSRWLVSLGRYGLKLLLKINRFVNWTLLRFGKERFSLVKKIKNSVKKAAKYCDDYEKSGIDIAIEKGYDFVICGHVHRPKKEIRLTKKGRCTYLNSGDWVENLTALEYSFKRWKIYRYNHDKLSPFYVDEDIKEMSIHELLVSTATVKNENDAERLFDEGIV